jgi:hypothetical protein
MTMFQERMIGIPKFMTIIIKNNMMGKRMKHLVCCGVMVSELIGLGCVRGM